jgi:hypothetical protein
MAETLKAKSIMEKAGGLPGISNFKAAGYLERGWVIANHKLVSFHAAFISSVLNLPASVEGKMATLQFMFVAGKPL